MCVFPSPRVSCASRSPNGENTEHEGDRGGSEWVMARPPTPEDRVALPYQAWSLWHPNPTLRLTCYFNYPLRRGEALVQTPPLPTSCQHHLS